MPAIPPFVTRVAAVTGGGPGAGPKGGLHVEASLCSDRPAPTLSVGLPVYNGARHLARALDSILQQTYGDLELIVSDNASTDDTADICATYAARDPRVRYYRQSQNIGLPGNWNFVVTLARGRYFKWASANDYLDPRSLAACVAMLEAAPEAVLAYSRTNLVEEGCYRLYADDLALTSPSPSERLRLLLDRLALNNAVSGVIRLSALRRTGLIRPYPGSDVVLMAELALQGQFLLVPEPLFYRRVEPGAMSSHLSEREVLLLHDPQSKGPAIVAARKYRDLLLATLRVKGVPFLDRCKAFAATARRAFWGRHVLWAEFKEKLLFHLSASLGMSRPPKA
jgi:glycosyltransferase involved in cell wall biosynthesis